MANTVITLKKSSSPSAVPVDLANGELAINYADGKLFFKNTAGFISEISGAGGGGSNFGTVNAAGTLIIADVNNDVLTINKGDNIDITGDAINDALTISADLSPANNYAVAVGSSGNAYSLTTATEIGTAGNNYTVLVGSSSNIYSISVGSAGNAYSLTTATSIGTAGNNYAVSIGLSSNAYALQTSNDVGTAGNNYVNSVGVAGNSYSLSTATSIGTSGNNYSVLIGTSGNTYSLATATDIGTAGNNYTNAVGVAGNNYSMSIGLASNNYTNLVGSSGNNYALGVATSIGTAGNNYASYVGTSANAYSDATFVKLTATQQTITGDIAITGNLTFLGNAVTITSNNLIIGDSLIYLAANNYSGTDLVDIGFIGNYGNTTGANVHTGLFRDHASKEYFLFQGYDAEPSQTNDIIPYSNNMVNAVLNADLKANSVIINGMNVHSWITAAYSMANSANVLAFGTGIGANNWANTLATAGNNYSVAIGTSGNAYALATATSIGTAGNNYALGVATSIGTAGNNYSVSLATAGNNYALGVATSIGTAGNNYATSVGVGANNFNAPIHTAGNNYATAVGAAGNAYALSTATSIGTAGNNYLIAIDTAGNNFAIAIGASANNWANTKLANTSGITFSGDFNVSGNLSSESTTFFVNAVTNRVGIGRTDPGYSLDVVGTVNATSLLVNGSPLSGGATLTNETSSSSTYYPVFTTATSGSMTVANTSDSKLYFVPSTGTLSATVFNSLSDVTFKTDIENFDGRTLIDVINPVTFKWKDTESRSYGVIAQDLEKTLPELVETNDQGIKSVSYMPMIAILVDVVKKQGEEIEKLKTLLNNRKVME